MSVFLCTFTFQKGGNLHCKYRLQLFIQVYQQQFIKNYSKCFISNMNRCVKYTKEQNGQKLQKVQTDRTAEGRGANLFFMHTGLKSLNYQTKIGC